jgi:hypothetical protein
VRQEAGNIVIFHLILILISVPCNLLTCDLDQYFAKVSSYTGFKSFLLRQVFYTINAVLIEHFLKFYTYFKGEIYDGK